MASLQRLTADCSIEDIIAVSDTDGGVIVDGLLDESLLRRFNDELEPLLAAHGGTDSGSGASDEFLGRSTRRLQALAEKAPAFVEIMLNEKILGYAEATLAPISPDIILNNGELIDIGPGESAQPIHRDDDAWNFANPGGPMIVNTITALVDITPAMGATLVVPGSHLWEKDRVPTQDEMVSADLPAGSSLLFRGDLLHAGGANNTDRFRRALSTGYCCGWLRPVENSYTNIPLTTVRKLPRRAQQLLGYALYDASEVGGGYLGYHDMGDPAKLLD